MKSAWIGFASRIIAQVLGATATVVLALLVAGKLSCSTIGNGQPVVEPAKDAVLVESVLFDERVNGDVHNISGLVQIGDGQFLFCDNNIPDALFELTLGPDGAKNGPIVRRPLAGIEPGQLDDIEALTLVEKGGARFVIATTSLLKRTSKKQGQFTDPPSGLVRIAIGADGSLTSERIPEFRDWFLKNVPDIGGAAILEPDEGGLNIEGLAWDAAGNRLLFGLRTPTKSKKPFIVPIAVGDIAGPWDTSTFQVQPSIRLNTDEVGEEAGIREVEYDSTRSAFLVLVGNATSNSKAPFLLYRWDGNAEGNVARVAGVWFNKRVKSEGITHAVLGGKGAVVIADDAGGYSVLWDSDERLK